MNRVKRGAHLVALVLSFAVLTGHVAYADRFSSPNYIIDASNTGHSVGGPQSSTSYSLISAGGESVVGNGTGGSYKMGQGYIAQLEQAIQLFVQPAGQVAYYGMDEGVGKVAYDNSANNQAITLGNQTYTAGKLGQALQFDGTANGSAIASPQLDFAASDFTTEFWLNPPDVTSTKDIFGKYEENVGGFAASIVNGQPILFVHDQNTYRYCSAVTANTWSHVVFVKQGTAINCYINGALANGSVGGTPAANIGTTTQPFKLGYANRYASIWNGKLDELKFFNRALDVEEVKAEYNAQNSGIPAGVAFAGSITPGASKTSGFDMVVQTDGPSYNLAINQNMDLTSGANTIAPVSGTIAAPVAWSESATKGLGFTMVGTNATALPGTWGSGNSYAALPNAPTTFYSRTGFTAGAKDVHNARLRLDVPGSQAMGTYTNQMTVTGTIIP